MNGIVGEDQSIHSKGPRPFKSKFNCHSIECYVWSVPTRLPFRLKHPLPKLLTALYINSLFLCNNKLVLKPREKQSRYCMIKLCWNDLNKGCHGTPRAPYRNTCLGFNWISRKRWIRPMQQTDEGVKRPVTHCSRLLVGQCARCGMSSHC